MSCVQDVLKGIFPDSSPYRISHISLVSEYSGFLSPLPWFFHRIHPKKGKKNKQYPICLLFCSAFLKLPNAFLKSKLLTSSHFTLSSFNTLASNNQKIVVVVVSKNQIARLSFYFCPFGNRACASFNSRLENSCNHALSTLRLPSDEIKSVYYEIIAVITGLHPVPTSALLVEEVVEAVKPF